MRLKAVLAAYLVAGVVPAHSAGGLTDIARNEHNYTLKLDLLTFVNGNWQGDAKFSVSLSPVTPTEPPRDSIRRIRCRKPRFVISFEKRPSGEHQ